MVDERNDTLTPLDILGFTCSKNFLDYMSSLEVIEVDAFSVCVLLFAFIAAFAFLVPKSHSVRPLMTFNLSFLCPVAISGP